MSLLDPIEDQVEELCWFRDSHDYAKITGCKYQNFEDYYTRKYKDREERGIYFVVIDEDKINIPKDLAKRIKTLILLNNRDVTVDKKEMLALEYIADNDYKHYIDTFDHIIEDTYDQDKHGTKITKVIEGTFNDGNNPTITVEDKYLILNPGDDIEDIVKSVCAEKVVPSLFYESENSLSWNYPKNYIGSILQSIPIHFGRQAHYENYDDGKNYLGVYIRNTYGEKEIILFPDVIRKYVKNDDELRTLIWKVIVHEYAHALMDAGSKCDTWIQNNKKYCFEKEESHANAFALRVLRNNNITPAQLKFVLDFIEHQPDAYKKGILVEKNSKNIGLDMIEWRMEKVDGAKYLKEI
ncbi:MAG: hypothetical protein IJK92_08980 [Bacteroidales bacterium]|nr:hypothetical protein [Bacteroidales bacterium]